jgi:hypothetical protein
MTIHRPRNPIGAIIQIGLRAGTALLLAPAVLFALAVPTVAQTQQSGRTADSAVGEVGQRETRADPATGIQPMARINNRIQNRVQSRIRNRIDRFYDPQANATSPFTVAGEQARTAGQATPR